MSDTMEGKWAYASTEEGPFHGEFDSAEEAVLERFGWPDEGEPLDDEYLDQRCYVGEMSKPQPASDYIDGENLIERIACDHDHYSGEQYQDAHAVVAAAEACWPGNPLFVRPRAYVVFTGGEPALQLDGTLVAAFRSRNWETAVETNGTRPLPPGLHWVSVSPKAGADLAVTSGDEIKLVFPQPGAEPSRYEGLDFGRFYLQPKDGPDRELNELAAARYCLDHPAWSLSLQAHKQLGLP